MDTNIQDRENRSKGLEMRLTYIHHNRRTFPTYPPQKRGLINEKALYSLNKINTVIKKYTVLKT